MCLGMITFVYGYHEFNKKNTTTNLLDDASRFVTNEDTYLYIVVDDNVELIYL